MNSLRLRIPFQRIPRYFFSTQISDEHFIGMQQAYFQKRNDQYIVELKMLKQREEITDHVNLYHNIEIELSSDQTLRNFYEILQEKVNIPNVKFCAYSLDQTEIAKITNMKQLFLEPFYITMDNKKMFYVESAQGYDEDNYKEIKQYFSKSEVPLLQRKIILSYLSRFDNLISLNFKTKIFQDHDKLTQQEKSVDKIAINDLNVTALESFVDYRNTQSDHEQGMYENYYKLKQLYDILREQRKQLMDVAVKRAKLQMFGGIFVLMGHFMFMSAGIYVYYDWNFMEPIGYFLNTGGTIYLSTQYFKLGSDWRPGKLSRYLINKNFEKLSQNSNYDIQKFNEVSAQLEEIRGRIKTNIVTNL